MQLIDEIDLIASPIVYINAYIYYSLMVRQRLMVAVKQNFILKSNSSEYQEILYYENLEMQDSFFSRTEYYFLADCTAASCTWRCENKTSIKTKGNLHPVVVIPCWRCNRCWHDGRMKVEEGGSWCSRIQQRQSFMKVFRLGGKWIVWIKDHTHTCPHTFTTLLQIYLRLMYT